MGPFGSGDDLTPVGSYIQHLIDKTDREMRLGHMQAARAHWLDFEAAKGMWLLSDARLEHMRVGHERASQEGGRT